MLINKNNKIVANASQPTISFTSMEQFTAWLTEQGMSASEASQFYNIIVTRTNNTPALFLGGKDCSVDIDFMTINLDSNGALTANTAILTDTATAKKYKLIITNGLLGIEEVE